MYLFVPCDKKSHGTEISFPIRSKCLSHPHPLLSVLLFHIEHFNGSNIVTYCTARSFLVGNFVFDSIFAIIIMY